jgi:hypothetical protein
VGKLRKPLFSDGASGKMDEESIFSHRLGKSYRKRFANPKQPNTKAQKETRATFTWALRAWQRDLTDEDRAAWRAYARKYKETDPFTLTPLKPPAHSLFIRLASQAKRAGYPAPKRPPEGPRPNPVQLALKPKGKGVKLRWEAPGSSPGQAQQKEGVVELWMAVTETWVNPWQSLFRVKGYVPAKIGEHYLSPLEPGKKYTFLARVLAPDGQGSLFTTLGIVIPG